MSGRRHMFAGIGLLALLGAALALPSGGCERKKDEAQKPARTESETAATVLEGEAPQLRLRPTTLAVKPPAPKPTGPLPAGASCVTAECHATYATAKFIHGPVSEKLCDSCHGPDTGTHVYPLLRKGNETCTQCHAVSGTLAVQHKAVEQGCVSCHSPHVSTAKFLLKSDTVEQVCATCHETPLKKYAHEPFATGQCMLCHQPHQAENKKLLRGGEGSKHCFTCHTQLRDQMAAASDVHQPAQDACTTCHHPHASDFEHELRQPVAQTCLSCHTDVTKEMASATVAHGAMSEAGSCRNCHNPHASNQKPLLAGREEQLCLKCHDQEQKTPTGRTVANMKPVLTESKYLHGPVKSGDCSACHRSHGAQQPALLVEAAPKGFYAPFDLENYALCFSCHDGQLALAEKTDHLTGFRNGEQNLHFLHVNRQEKGRTCKTCHEMHGSNLPNHIASGVPFEGSNWAMPIRYEKTKDGGSCTPGCHSERSYHRTASSRPAASQPISSQPMTRGAS